VREARPEETATRAGEAKAAREPKVARAPRTARTAVIEVEVRAAIFDTEVRFCSVRDMGAGTAKSV
jgi:hypothetical protein